MKNKDQVILLNLNINSNKISFLQELALNNIDVLVIDKTKLDDTFPEGCFTIPGYKNPFSKYRGIHGRWVMVFIREDIHSRN